MEKFNMFKVLSKDDKELIHSSFISFLLNENAAFTNSLLRIDKDLIKEIITESSTSAGRFDIQIELVNGEKIIIENKFKSMPDLQQLKNYDEFVDKNKWIVKEKLIVCFDDVSDNLLNGWRVVTYSHMLAMIKAIYEKEKLDNEKAIFVRHYCEFLSEYLVQYSSLKVNCYDIFCNAEEKKNKFWQTLFISKIASSLRNSIAHVNCVEPNGSTKVPVLNIIPSSSAWKYKGNELLVQFQGSHLKLYMHSADKKIVSELQEHFKESIRLDVTYKKQTARSEKTTFIYKTSLTKLFQDEKATAKGICEKIIKFYEQANECLEQLQRNTVL